MLGVLSVRAESLTNGGKMPIDEALYLQRNNTTQKWELIGMYSEKVYGSYDSKKQANEEYIKLTSKNDANPPKRKAM